MAKGKNFIKAKDLVDSDNFYSVNEAVELVEKTKRANFDESVDIAIKLGIDPRQADQQIRTAVNLPHGTGKDISVLVFAKDNKADEAKEAGADFVGLDEYVEKITKENWLGFDVAIATPDVMNIVGKLGKFLGPRGLMPNPKVGTVTKDISEAVQQSKAGRIEIKNDKGGVVHAPIGKASFGNQKIKENMLAIIDNINKLKPSSSKGIFLKKVSVSNTMGPGINLDLSDIKESLKGEEK
ncbi:MAG: 50S ribosomal protein L1 [Thermodesulfobacteriota bacterium]